MHQAYTDNCDEIFSIQHLQQITTKFEIQH